MAALKARQPCYFCRDNAVAIEVEVRDPDYTRPTDHPTGPPTLPSPTSLTTTTSSASPSTQATTPSTQTTLTSSGASAATTISSGDSSQAPSGSSTYNPAATGASTSSSSSTSVAALAEASHYDSGSGPSAGTIAAAVIVPALIVLLALAAFIIIRRKRRSSKTSTPAMRESGVAPFITPMMMSNTNTTYYTGLDTGSELDGNGDFYATGRSDTSSYSEPPPPPYKARTHTPTFGNSSEIAAIPGHPEVRIPTGMPSNPPSRDSWTTPEDGSHPDSSSGITPSVAVTSRSGSLAPTDHSVNSDLYSEDASVHSAQAARLSVAGPPVQQNDPFEDPDSPMSSDGEGRSFNSARSRSISPVGHESV